MALYDQCRTVTSYLALVSLRTRLEAREENATVWPSAEIAVKLLEPLVCWPSLEKVTHDARIAWVGPSPPPDRAAPRSPTSASA
jgi:hypothetical protein